MYLALIILLRQDGSSSGWWGKRVKEKESRGVSCDLEALCAYAVNEDKRSRNEEERSKE